MAQQRKEKNITHGTQKREKLNMCHKKWRKIKHMPKKEKTKHMATRKIKHIAQQRNCEKANTLRRKEKEKKTHSTKN